MQRRCQHTEDEIVIRAEHHDFVPRAPCGIGPDEVKPLPYPVRGDVARQAGQCVTHLPACASELPPSFAKSAVSIPRALWTNALPYEFQSSRPSLRILERPSTEIDDPSSR